MLIPSNSQPLLACHWCKQEGVDNDADRSVKLINGTMAGICTQHLTTQWDANQIRSVDEK
jgi:hypothetical protein